MKHLALLAALAVTAPVAVAAQDAPATPTSVVASAAPEDWAAIAPEDMLIMDLAPAADGAKRRVVIQLMPPPFSQPWVTNIRTLARAGWWDGTSVYRVVDNWVAQWGDVSEEKALPEGLGVAGEDEYTADSNMWRSTNETQQTEPETDLSSLPVLRPVSAEIIPMWHSQDAYANWVEFFAGWPVATAGIGWNQSWWPIHCYGSVGVARNVEDTGTGSELYTVIGHAPRQLDRNIAVVGRVIEGIEHLSTLPRGTGDAGVYEDRGDDTAILSVRLASELTDPPAFEYLDTSSASFARYVAVRANRNDAFYTVPAGGVDVCNVQVPVRLQER